MCEAMKRIGGPVLLLMLALFQVTPVLARSDDLIQREIEAQMAASTMLRDTRIKVHIEQRLVVVAVDNGVVSIQASFSGVGDSVFLKHKVEEIEGMVDIEIRATFLAWSGGTQGRACVKPQRTLLNHDSRI